MTRPEWADDDALMRALAEALAEAGPLATVASGGEAAWSWRTVDEDLEAIELASLTFDSSLQPLATRAAAEEAKTLVFSAEPLSVELEVRADSVAGQIVPPGPGQVTLEMARGERVGVDADDLGFFVLPVRPEGPVRLRCETATSKLVTDWVQL